ALRRVGRLDDGRLADDRDALGQRAHLQREVEDDEGLRADADAALLDRLVALQRRRHLVRARLYGGEDIFAPLVRRRRAFDVRRFVGEGHLHAGHDAARVLHGSAQAALEALSRHGDSTPGSVRSALPNWFTGVVENAALL